MTHGSQNLVETAYPDYVEVTSKHSGGKIEYFLCPHCRAMYDAFGNAQLALDSCVAHAKTCAPVARS